MEARIHPHTDLNAFEEPGDDDGRFNNSIFDNLPALLKGGTDVLSGNDRQVFLLGALAVLSSVLPNYYALYDKERIEANLFVFLVGGFASGKGALRYAKAIVKEVHTDLRERQTEPDGEGRQMKSRLFVPANSSKTGIAELLSLNDGRGLIFETEADTLSDILKQDYGNFSDLLRKAYHHEDYSIYRRLNKENIEIEKLYVSVLLSGTPSQLKRLIPSPENGLLSRFMFFELITERDFRNPFSDTGTDFEPHFVNIGSEVLVLFRTLKEQVSPLCFRFTQPQQAEFNDYFSQLKQSAMGAMGDDVAGFVHRFGVQFTRVAMILTVLRKWESGGLQIVSYCHDIDFHTTMQMMEVFIQHALNIFNNMAVNCLESLPESKKDFYQALPEEFRTSDAVETGLRMEFSERTTKRFIDNRELFANLRHGQYRKLKMA